MVMNPERRKEILTSFKTHDKDTGGCEVQVALLTERITGLTGHLKSHPKDYHSRLGLERLVSQRTRLLSYLRETDLDRYKGLIERLGLRK